MSGHRRRPRWIVAGSALLWLGALGMPFQVMVLYGHPPTELSAIWAKLAPQNVAVMFLSAAAAIGLVRVRPWGWWAATALLLAASVNNLLLLRYPSPYPSPVILTGTVGLLAGLSWMGTPGVLHLFRNPGLHWWKTPRRLRLHVPSRVDLPGGLFVEAHTFDISRNGVYLVTGCASLQRHHQVDLHLVLGGRVIQCTASLVRRNDESTCTHPAGYGLAFHRMGLADRLLLRYHLAAAILR